jgi:hypothetical protein
MSSSIFELRDGRYVAAIFWTAIEGTNGATIDMLGMLWRDDPREPWTFRFRTRIHGDGFPDEKQTAEAHPSEDEDEDELVETLVRVWKRAQELGLQAGVIQRVLDKPHAIPVKSNRAEVVLQVLLAQPFSQVTS